MDRKKVILIAGGLAVAFVAWRVYVAAKVTPVTRDNAAAIQAAWKSGGVAGVRAYLADTGQGPISAAQAQAKWGLSSPDVGYLINAGVLR